MILLPASAPAKMDARSDERAIAMKSVMNWFVLGVFALQATGVVWCAHLAECSEPDRAASCQCGRGHDNGTHAFAWDDLRAAQHHPAAPSKPSPQRHDPQKCSICQVLLTLAATTGIPPALPAISEVRSEPLAPSDQPAHDTFLSAVDARGPPAYAF